MNILKNISRQFCLKNIVILFYPLFLMILERSLRDLGIGETVEYMGVTLTAASVAFLIPVMFIDSNIRVTLERIVTLDQIKSKNLSVQERNLVIGDITRQDNKNILSNWATFIFFFALPAWFFTVIWSITPDEVINWFGIPNSICVSFKLSFIFSSSSYFNC